jgi:hypothetical protein
MANNHIASLAKNSKKARDSCRQVAKNQEKRTTNEIRSKVARKALRKVEFLDEEIKIGKICGLERRLDLLVRLLLGRGKL